MWARRDFLKLGAWSLAAGCDRARFPTAAERPRSVVIVYLDGGIDPVLTLDPKRPDDVSVDVDLPYHPEDIVRAGPIELGPHFARLAPWAARMAIIRGVRLDTANHYTGWGQITRMRTRVFPGMPTLLDVIGERRDGQPLASISIGDLSSAHFSTGHADGHGVFQLHEARREQLGPLATILRTHAATLAGDARARRTGEHYRHVGALAERLRDVSPFTPRPWPGVTDALARDLQRVLWALEHDLVRCAFIKIRPYGGWDSHNHNLLRQANCSRAFVDAFVPFLRELDTRRNAHGTLAERTLLVLGSEIGRFPRLNGNLGKDHFPETAFALLGSGIRGGQVYGATDERMMSVPVELASGQRTSRGGHAIRLDDLGATLLAIAGIAPEPCGYTGKVLPFLVRT